MNDVVETQTWTAKDEQNKYNKHWPANLEVPSFQPNQQDPEAFDSEINKEQQISIMR